LMLVVHSSLMDCSTTEIKRSISRRESIASWFYSDPVIWQEPKKQQGLYGWGQARCQQWDPSWILNKSSGQGDKPRWCMMILKR
jgi:hypothetical protein